jgi:hypothetical protein
MAYFNTLAVRYPLFADGQAALAVMQFALGSGGGSGSSGSGSSAGAGTGTGGSSSSGSSRGSGISSSGGGGDYMSSAREAWESALEQDSRYVDVEWVRDIRRWPPALVGDLQLFKARLAHETSI